MSAVGNSGPNRKLCDGTLAATRRAAEPASTAHAVHCQFRDLVELSHERSIDDLSEAIVNRGIDSVATAIDNRQNRFIAG